MANSIEGIIDSLISDNKIPREYEEEFGYVCKNNGQIISLFGLPNVEMHEIIYNNKNKAFIIQINQGYVKAILLTNNNCQVGDQFIRGNKQLFVSVGSHLLGNMFGNIDEIQKDGEERFIFPEPKPFTDNKNIDRQLYTGINIIDWMIPIGYGQRQLILGDKGSGKSAISQSIMMNQIKNNNVICIYVFIGQSKSQIKSFYNKLKKSNSDNFILFYSCSDDLCSLRYLIPYVAATVGEYFMDQGKDVVVFFDNLDTHAKAYRELSSFAGDSPGKETYPKDIFYQHAKLLERGMCSEVGSLTFFPIVSIVGEELNYISTSIISITDGQIILNSKLLQMGQFPGIDVGLSVSRIGTSVMDSEYKKLTKGLKLLQIENIEEKRKIKLNNDNISVNKQSALDIMCSQISGCLYEKHEQILLLYYLEITKFFTDENISKFMLNIKNYTSKKDKILTYNIKSIKAMIGE